MSRIGKQLIPIPAGVEVNINGQVVSVKGPKGEISVEVNRMVKIAKVEEDGVVGIQATVSNEDDTKQKAQWGTARAIIANLVIGVTEGFSKKLEINGVGFRVSLSGKKLILNIGFSHPVEFELPEGIVGKVEENVITISGIDKHLVGEVVSRIRSIKKPEPYKGKGIKYVDEQLRRKAGKTAKTGE